MHTLYYEVVKGNSCKKKKSWYFILTHCHQCFLLWLHQKSDMKLLIHPHSTACPWTQCQSAHTLIYSHSVKPFPIHTTGNVCFAGTDIKDSLKLVLVPDWSEQNIHELLVSVSVAAGVTTHTCDRAMDGNHSVVVPLHYILICVYLLGFSKGKQVNKVRAWFV